MSDYIKREDAIKAIKKDIMGGLNYESILNDLPSADVVEVRRGKWIKAADDGERSFYAECDQCHKVTPNGWNMNYCPNCGARMDGESDE